MNKPLVFSILLHVGILILLIGIETNHVIQITPQSEEPAIINASLVFNRPITHKPIIATKSEPKPESKVEPDSVPEPEIMTKNIVVIKNEKKPPPPKLVENKPDKKREKELKEMAQQSLEQAFKQESLQDDLQKKLQEHDLEQQSAAFSQTEINQYMAIIANKVKKNWRQPIDTKLAGLACVVIIKMLSNGEVMDVRVIESSGHLGFDRSTEIAVRKSSPLPTPKNEIARAQFKQFEFSFKPEG